jgi:hypothetical protein
MAGEASAFEQVDTRSPLERMPPPKVYPRDEYQQRSRAAADKQATFDNWRHMIWQYTERGEETHLVPDLVFWDTDPIAE